jgi:hypothetical protein
MRAIIEQPQLTATFTAREPAVTPPGPKRVLNCSISRRGRAAPSLSQLDAIDQWCFTGMSDGPLRSMGRISNST